MRSTLRLHLPVCLVLVSLVVVALCGCVTPAVAQTAVAPPGEDNSCVLCHRQPETLEAFPRWGQDQFLHWYGAVHGRAGITCEACHGGDPTKFEKAAAHVGVKSWRDPTSPTYPTNQPQTCAKCHERITAAFAASKHHDALQNLVLAPTCTTCHGVQMDVNAVSGLQMVARCTVCHNETERGVMPEAATRAQELLTRSEQVDDLIAQAIFSVGLAREFGRVPGSLSRRLAKAQDQYEATALHWHDFNLDAFAEELSDVHEEVLAIHNTALDALTTH